MFGHVLLWLSMLGVCEAGDFSPEQLIGLGERLYLQGITVSGTPVRAISQGDVHMQGTSAACVKCHRASGFGASEGGYYVPPITGPLLFAPRELDRARLFPDLFQQVQPSRFIGRLHQPHMRPAYTPETLGDVLRNGTDPAGQALAAIMPRYELSNEDVSALTAYLGGLSSQISPGVDKQEIQFATVFSDNVPAADREAVLKTMQAYIDWNNQNFRNDQARGNFSPMHRTEFVTYERPWKLHAWTLHGPASTWNAQIEELYRQTNAFALIGGIVRGPWASIGKFCDNHKIPCILPITDLPHSEAQGGYTILFSEGLALEAKALAYYLATTDTPVHRVFQFASTEPFGEVPSTIFQQWLTQLKPELIQRTLPFTQPSELRSLIETTDFNPEAGDVLVLWPGAEETQAVQTLLETQIDSAYIFLPSRAIPSDRTHVDPRIRKVRFVEPHEISITSHPRSFVVRAWMRSRKLEIDRPLLQFQTYYALSLVDAALATIREDYFREYLIERIERESEKDLNPGIYPRLSLGPTQRYAAKGAFLVTFDSEHPELLKAVSEWIVP